jgi:hypothetical protein
VLSLRRNSHFDSRGNVDRRLLLPRNSGSSALIDKDSDRGLDASFEHADRIRPTVPQPTKWQRIGNQIDAALGWAWSHFVNVNDRMQTQWWMRLTQGSRSSE